VIDDKESKSNPEAARENNQEQWHSKSRDGVAYLPTKSDDNRHLESSNSSNYPRLYYCIDVDEQSLKQSDDDSTDPKFENSTTISTEDQQSDDASSQPSKHSYEKSNCQATSTQCIMRIHKPLRFALVETSAFAAKHPIVTISAISALAIVLGVVGLLTNFRVEHRANKLWTPQGSLPDQHGQWIDSVFPTGFDPRQYFLTTLLHADGGNVVSFEAMRQQFAVIERIRSVVGYTEFCREYGKPICGEDEPALDFACRWYGIPNDSDNRDCQIFGVTSFWFQNYTLYHSMVFSDTDIQRTLSIKSLPGRLADFDISNIVGYPQFDNNGTLTGGKSFLTGIELPRTDFRRSELLERSVTEALKKLQVEINSNSSNPFRLEILATRSFEDEIARGVSKDMMLLPVVGLFLTAFTCLVFYKHGDWLHSRVLLGIGATGTVVISIMTGYGLLFVLGVPFTSLAQVSSDCEGILNTLGFLSAFSSILPCKACIFIIFGIALDDTFIIFGYYIHTDSNQSPVERIRETMEEVGTSIFMTTVTSVLAFGLGCWTTIPAIQWMCIYGLTTISIDFVWQITFFVALLVLDERRIAKRRRDVFICYKVPESACSIVKVQEREHLSVQLMRKYTDILLKPWVKCLVLLCFTGLFGVCAWSATKLSVKFELQGMFPGDSYVNRYLAAMTNYTQRQGPAPYIYFRFVNQSDSYIQTQMEAYVNASVNTRYITNPPFKFWLHDFNSFKSSNAAVQNLPFNEAIRLFLDDPATKDYKNDFVLDHSGKVLATRTLVHMDKINPNNIDSEKGALPNLLRLTRQQPMNQQTEDWPFFIFDKTFYIWEFLIQIPSQLKQTTIIGIISVTLVSVFFMPHWSGALFVGPLTMMLYVDLLGIFQFANISIKGVSYVCLVMAIGLLVDYALHVMLRFQESTKSTRNEKARDVLESTGASVLSGGMTTFLGVLPLVFATSRILTIFVISLISVVLVGLLHGLMFMPVVLSIIGPTFVPPKQIGNNNSEPEIFQSQRCQI
jgi:Niemann-Pick C1 protein